MARLSLVQHGFVELIGQRAMKPQCGKRRPTCRLLWFKLRPHMKTLYICLLCAHDVQESVFHAL